MDIGPDTAGAYAEARSWFQRAINDYFGDEPVETAELNLLIGKTYQDEGKWEQADELYQAIETEFPMSSAVFQVPFMRYLHHKSLGDQQEAMRVLDEVIERYKFLVTTDANSKLASRVRKFSYQALVRQGDWDALLSHVDWEFAQETDDIRKGRWLFLKALITQNRLKDRERALQLYHDFLSEYPDHELTRLAKHYRATLIHPGRLAA